MAYEKHEMSVMLFSKEDAVFADDSDIEITSTDTTEDDWFVGDDGESDW